MKRIYAIISLTIWIVAGMLIVGVNAQKNQAETVATQANTEKSEITADRSDYIIGPEDVLNIYVWKEESLTKTAVPVRIDGKISLPLVDDIQAEGLTPLKLKEIITQKLKIYIDKPTVTITVIEANSYKIYISGEVKTPGVMRIRSQTTLLQAITTAGGFTEWANKRKILIITNENGREKRMTVNYNKILDGDEPDVIIKRGDTIIVR